LKNWVAKGVASDPHDTTVDVTDAPMAFKTWWGYQYMVSIICPQKILGFRDIQEKLKNLKLPNHSIANSSLFPTSMYLQWHF
jgi:hypothetical protein